MEKLRRKLFHADFSFLMDSQRKIQLIGLWNVESNKNSQSDIICETRCQCKIQSNEFKELQIKFSDAMEMFCASSLAFAV